jgi:hypothetical protein
MSGPRPNSETGGEFGPHGRRHTMGSLVGGSDPRGILIECHLTFTWESVRIDTPQYFCPAKQRHPAENSSV